MVGAEYLARRISVSKTLGKAESSVADLGFGRF